MRKPINFKKILSSKEEKPISYFGNLSLIPEQADIEDAVLETHLNEDSL